MNYFNWEPYHTDKETHHNYGELYDKHFSGIRTFVDGTVVEIGNRKGSTELWLDYFPNCNVLGCDLVQYAYNNPRFNFKRFNQLSVQDHIDLPFQNIDVIIEDGPHTSKAQFLTIETVLPLMKSNSWLIIEDLHCTEPGDSYYPKNAEGCDTTVNLAMREWKNGIFKNYNCFEGEKLASLPLKFYIEKGRISEILFIHKWK